MDIRDVIAASTRSCVAGATTSAPATPPTSSRQIDRYVAWRLKRLLVKRYGRNLRAGQADTWTRDWFEDQGLHRLSGTIRYPRAA